MRHAECLRARAVLEPVIAIEMDDGRLRYETAGLVMPKRAMARSDLRLSGMAA